MNLFLQVTMNTTKYSCPCGVIYGTCGHRYKEGHKTSRRHKCWRDHLYYMCAVWKEMLEKDLLPHLGETTVLFGKYKGETWQTVWENDPVYIRWVVHTCMDNEYSLWKGPVASVGCYLIHILFTQNWR